MDTQPWLPFGVQRPDLSETDLGCKEGPGAVHGAQVRKEPAQAQSPAECGETRKQELRLLQGGWNEMRTRFCSDVGWRLGSGHLSPHLSYYSAVLGMDGKRRLSHLACQADSSEVHWEAVALLAGTL